MEVTVEKLKDWDFNYSYYGYTVYVGDHRILTISTYSDDTATKWIKDVQKCHNTKHGTLVVGVCADHRSLQFEKGGLKDSPYDLLQLCVGSHCLLYHLPEPDFFQTPKFLQTFFADPRVIAVGMNMASVAKKLEKDHDLKFANPVDLNSMAVKGMKRDDLDLGRYDLDRLAKAVLGKHMDVIRPAHKLEWYKKRFYWFSCAFTLEKVKYATVDPYLCFLIGSALLDMMGGASCFSSLKKKKMKKKKN